MSALLECLVFLIKRGRAVKDVDAHALEGKSPSNRSAEVVGVVEQQIVRTWEELASRRLRVDAETAGNLVARTLTSLDSMDNGWYFTSSTR